jgi:hypothetical protein
MDPLQHSVFELDTQSWHAQLSTQKMEEEEEIDVKDGDEDEGEGDEEDG